MSSIQNNCRSTNEEEDFLFATQLATSSVLCMSMQVAIELDVFGIIAKAGAGAQVSPTHIASQLPTKNPDASSMLDRLLRLLTSHSILTSSLITHDSGAAERLYGLGPVCKYFVPGEDGMMISPWMLLNQGKVCMESWYHMRETILEGGQPFQKAHGMHFFDYAGVDTTFNEMIYKTMFNHTTIVMKKILEIYKGLHDLQVVVDVGGGVGTAINMITTMYPAIKGINFDLPHVIKHAPSHPGVEHVGGNMFENVPKGDALIMKWILHDWTDQHCLRLLKNCYKALPDHGKLILLEAILPIAAKNDTAARSLCQLDVLMLSHIPGGKERTEEEFNILANEAGFTCMKKVCRVYNFWVMEFSKT